MAIESSSLVGGSWCLTGADGTTIATGGGVETITPPSGSRVVIDFLINNATPSNRWSLTAGGNTVFADTDIILDDNSPTLQNSGRISVTNNGSSNQQFNFAVDEIIVITNIALGADIWAAWHYEERR